MTSYCMYLTFKHEKGIYLMLNNEKWLECKTQPFGTFLKAARCAPNNGSQVIIIIIYITKRREKPKKGRFGEEIVRESPI